MRRRTFFGTAAACVAALLLSKPKHINPIYRNGERVRMYDLHTGDEFIMECPDGSRLTCQAMSEPYYLGHQRDWCIEATWQ